MLQHFLKTREENLLRVTAPNCQPDLPPSNRITTGTTLLPLSATFLHASPCLSPCILRLLSSFSFTSLITLSPKQPLFPFPPLHLPPFLLIPLFFLIWHTFTLFSLFPACFPPPPRSWYEVSGRQRDRSNDPGWTTLLCKKHGGHRKTSPVHTDYISMMYWVGPLGICDVKSTINHSYMLVKLQPYSNMKNYN